MSEATAAVGYAFEPLEPSEPPPRDAPTRLLAQARAESEQLREQARAEGYADGHRAGQEQAATDISNAMSTLAEAVRGVESLRSEVSEALERDAVELALALAGKILAAARRAPAEEVLEAVRGALQRIGERREIVVLVNPADCEAVGASLERLIGTGSGVDSCELRADDGVAQGGAVVRTAEGEVDASVATQLRRAHEIVQTSLALAEPGA